MRPFWFVQPTKLCIVTALLYYSLVVAHAFAPLSRCNNVISGRTASSTATVLSGALEFVEPETGVKVRLIGAMHYNPASIQLVADSIQELQEQGRLGSVLIESCPSRWNSTLNNGLPPSVTRLLVSEMRTAHDLAIAFGRPVVLGDQPIETTVERLKEGLGQTLRELLAPIEGWKSLAANLTSVWPLAIPFGSQYLGASALLDPRLLLSAPVSLFKYPMSYFVRDPLASSLVLGLLFGADTASAAALGQPTTVLDQTAQVLLHPQDYSYTLMDGFVDLLGSALEVIIFGRLFLQVLLVERNNVLALNILEQCRYYQSSKPKKTSVWDWLPMWDRGLHKVPYAETSPKPSKPAAAEDAVVVAVLGMAHVNGIRKLLEQRGVH